MKKFIAEFKEFITKGNALDLAIGVVIGAAFGAIVNSLVEDLIMPIIGILLGKVSFADLLHPVEQIGCTNPCQRHSGCRKGSRSCGLCLWQFLDDYCQLPDHWFCHFPAC